MPLLRSSVRGFSALEHHLAQRLAEQMSIQTGHSPSASERRSWERSLPALRADLIDAGLHDVEMLVEYQLPLTSKRADVVLAGVHPRTGHPSYVVVELKQWSRAEAYEGSDTLVSIEQYGGRAVTHPAVQVEGYVDYIADFTSHLAETDHSLVGAAYLHNATDRDVEDLFVRPPSERSRLFTGQRRSAFGEFLAQHLAPGESGAAAADALLGSRIAPSRQLLSVAADEVQRREMFVLLDEQRDAYEHVLHAVERARRANTKRAIVVSGGPGSGKSVIALSLMGELSRQGRTVVHATGSRSFTQTLRRVAGARAPRVQKLFKYFNSFMTAEVNDLDCLILDEAHRIRETSVNRYTRKEQRVQARPQIHELLSAARVPVFLLDEHQVVRPGELGTVQDIERYAAVLGIEVEEIRLDDQFRCGGSQIYVDWVVRLLGLVPGGPVPWTGDDGFDVEVVDSPLELGHVLGQHHADGYTARVAAGYCWPWSDPRPDGTLVDDVVIDDWSRPWNLRGERSVGGAPPSALWASDPAGFGQVGCIYTAQGFEYDHAGVILGPDLVWREGRWVTVREANRDPDFRSRAKVPDEDFDRLVRNVYKVLLTRGMRSVQIYSTDPQTRDFLRTLVRP
ncbi:DNA/RNA helicase domain-containing protein [Janibacter terrae]|uniref:DNA/RNA helicase domain-containing protein n=1 Tax=Janibacter terrae TaxID=103817 RepID=UPI0038133E48